MWTDGRRRYIYDTVVFPAYRGRGIASDLGKSSVAALQNDDLVQILKRFLISEGSGIILCNMTIYLSAVLCARSGVWTILAQR